MARNSTPRPYHVKIVRYHTSDGQRCTSTTPGAIKSVEESETWSAKIKGKVVSLETRDEAIAWTNLNKLLRAQRERELGVRDDFLDAAEQPLTEHVSAWLATVAAEQVSAKQVSTLRADVLRLASLAGWSRITDIAADSCLLALARLQASTEDGGFGLSAQTRNHYARHVRQFTAWLTDHDKLRRDPLRRVKSIGVEEDRRHDRRVPTNEEIKALFDYLHSATARVRLGMTGQQRALAYQVSMATGFRANEVRNLDRESFDLGGKPTCTLRARADKRRRAAVQPLPSWLADSLRSWFSSGGDCWSWFPESFPGRLLKADLLASGVAPETPGPNGPLFLDWHSLRSWYVTQLAGQAGIDPKTLMTLARHSTPALTLKVYAKAKGEKLDAAAAAIPDPRLASPVDNQNNPVDSSVVLDAQATASEPVQVQAKGQPESNQKPPAGKRRRKPGK